MAEQILRPTPAYFTLENCFLLFCHIVIWALDGVPTHIPPLPLVFIPLFFPFVFVMTINQIIDFSQE